MKLLLVMNRLYHCTLYSACYKCGGFLASYMRKASVVLMYSISAIQRALRKMSRSVGGCSGISESYLNVDSAYNASSCYFVKQHVKIQFHKIKFKR